MLGDGWVGMDVSLDICQFVNGTSKGAIWS